MDITIMWRCRNNYSRVSYRRHNATIMWQCRNNYVRVSCRRHNATIMWQCRNNYFRVSYRRHNATIMWQCRNNYFRISYRRHMSSTFVRQRSCIGDACSSGNMAPLLYLLLIVFNMSFLPTYHVKYYYHITQ